MGRYIIAVLKKQYQKDSDINGINETLSREFGATAIGVFNTLKYLQEEADFFNTDPEGLKQIPHFDRPLTPRILHENFFWYRLGEFHFKISGGAEATDAMNVIAVCKWIIKSRGKYINKKESSNYDKKIVGQYLDPVFEESGYDLKTIWKM